MLLIIAIYIIFLFLTHLIVQKYSAIKRYLLFATMFTSSVGGGTLIGIPEHIRQSLDISIIIGLIITEITSIIFIYLYKNRILTFSKYLDILKEYNQEIIKISSLLLTCGYCAIQIHILHKAIYFIGDFDYQHTTILTIGIYLLSLLVFNNQSILNTNILQFLIIIISTPIIIYYLYAQLENYLLNNGDLSPISIYKQDHFTSIFQQIFYYIYHNITYSFSNILNYTMIFSLTFINPTFIKNIILNKASPMNIQYNAINKSVFYIIFIILLSIQACLSHNLHFNEWFNVLSHTLSQKIYTLFLISIIAASISTLAIDTLIIKETYNTNIYQYAISNIICAIIIFSLAYSFDNPIEIALLMTITWSPITLFPIIFKLHQIIFYNTIFILNTCIIIIYLFLYYLFDIKIYILSPTITAIIISALIYIIAYLFKLYLPMQENLKTYLKK